MNDSSTGTSSMTFQVVDETVTTQPRVGTTTQQVARYLADDLHRLVREAEVDLPRWLDIPAGEYLDDRASLVELLGSDLEQMLRDQLIQAVYFLLSELKPDGNSGRYRLGYQAEYRIDIPEHSTGSAALSQFGGRLQLPTNPWLWARFSLLVEWNPAASIDDVRQARRPRYLFDWVPAQDEYSDQSLLEYRQGGLGTVVLRIESTVPSSIPVH